VCGPHGPQQLRTRGVLEQVAGGAGLDGRQHVAVGVEGGQHEHPHRGRQLGQPAARESGQKVRTITLKARTGKATATLDVVNADNFPAHSCRPERAAGFRVFPPGSKKSFYVTRSHRVCTVGRARNHVRPVAS